MSGNGHGEGGRALGRSEGLCARRGAARRSFRIRSRDGRERSSGKGWNRVLGTNDPTARTEMEAIRASARSLGSFTRAGGDFYTSAQPCPLCWGEAYWACIVRV